MKRVKLPEFLQMENAECGAASLKIMLEHFGSKITIDTSKKAIGIGRDGSTARELINAAAGFGLSLVPAKVTFEEIKSSVKPPYILFWDSCHWLTVEGFSEGFLYVSDPAKGNVRYREEEARENFSGLILTPLAFDKTQIRNEDVNPDRNLLKIASNFYKPLLVTFALAILSIIPEISFALAIGIFAERVATGNIDYSMLSSAWFLFFITGVFLAFLALRQYVLRLMSKYIFLDSSKKLISKLISAPLLYYPLRSIGDLGSRVSRLTILSKIATNLFIPGLFTTIRSILVVILLFFIEWKLAFFVFLVYLIGALIVVKNAKISVEDSAVNDIYSATCFGILVDVVRSSELVKSTGSEISYFQNWASNYAMYISASQGVSVVNANISTVITISGFVLNTGVLFISAFLIMNGSIELATYTAFLYMSTMVSEGLSLLPPLVSSFSQISGFKWRLNDTLGIQSDSFSHFASVVEAEKPDQSRNTQELELSDESSIELVDVTFSYPGAKKPTYTDVNFKFEHGSFSSVVGPSGSGKSTLIKNICGLVPVSSGLIKVCGINQQELSQEISHSIFSYVPQDCFLFEGSLFDNITMLDNNIEQSVIDKYVELTDLYNILNISHDLHSCHIEDRGSNLSGGQKQIVELSRALIRQPKFLILDEATSGIDVNLERFIFERVSQLDLTILSIAHRKTALDYSDHILDLQQFISQS